MKMGFLDSRKRSLAVSILLGVLLSGCTSNARSISARDLGALLNFNALLPSPPPDPNLPPDLNYQSSDLTLRLAITGEEFVQESLKQGLESIGVELKKSWVRSTPPLPPGLTLDSTNGRLTGMSAEPFPIQDFQLTLEGYSTDDRSVRVTALVRIAGSDSRALGDVPTDELVISGDSTRLVSSGTVFDISDPKRPKVVAQFPMWDYMIARGISSTGRYVFFEQQGSTELDASIRGQIVRIDLEQLDAPPLVVTSRDGTWQTGALNYKFTRQSTVKSVDVSADGRWVAFSANSSSGLVKDARGFQVYLKDLQKPGQEPQLISAPQPLDLSNECSGEGLSLSPDGSWIAYVSRNDDARLGFRDRSAQVYRRRLLPELGVPGWVSLVDGTQAKGLPYSSCNSLHVAISPDGRYVAFGGQVGFEGEGGVLPIYIKDMSRASVAPWIATSPTGKISDHIKSSIAAQSLKFSADGKYIYFLSEGLTQENTGPFRLHPWRRKISAESPLELLSRSLDGAVPLQVCRSLVASDDNKIAVFSCALATYSSSNNVIPGTNSSGVLLRRTGF